MSIILGLSIPKMTEEEKQEIDDLILNREQMRKRNNLLRQIKLEINSMK